MKRILAALALTLVAAASLAADDLDRINTKPVMARMTRGPFVPVEASGSPTAQRIEFYRAVTDVIQSENGTTSTFQPACSDLTAICALTTTAYGRGLLECTANTDCKTYLGIAGGSGGLGDVVGPASATDHALARFDGITGKLIEDSTATLADDGRMTIAASSVAATADTAGLTINATMAPASVVGSTFGALLNVSNTGAAAGSGALVGAAVYATLAQSTVTNLITLDVLGEVAAGKSTAGAYGLNSQALNAGTVINLYGGNSFAETEPGGVTTTQWGHRIQSVVDGGGTLGTNYGLQIDAITGGATDNYAIASDGGDSYHVGKFRFGGNTDAVKTVDITGTLGATGQITSTLATGTAPFSIASTTLVPNLYVARAVLADTVTVADAAGDTTTFPMLAGSATGSLPLLTDAGLTYNATTNALTASTFVGALTGNADTASAVAVGGITGLGTGVATALAVNVGSAGAFVTFNGALGTPNSGVATNLTGTAASLTAGSVTTNANLTGPVTSVGNATTITDAAVTLAKMANLAQDQFIGRVTASTGVPETATITSAARTVLDDTTVSAMVDTLGGASATGTGALVRKTNAALVTPDLGTPSAAVLTSATGLPLTTGVTGTLPTANGGTNKSSAYAVGDVVYASGTTTLAGLADVATGAVLISGGLNTAPSWSANPPLTTVVFGSASGGTGTLSQAATASTLAHTLPDDSARLVGRVAIVGTTNTAAITAGALYTPNSTNMYRVSFVLTTLRAATTSSIMGAGVNLNYTTGDGSVAVVQNVPMESQTATTGFTDSGDATNTVGATLIGNVVVYALTSVAMTYDVSYTSVGGTSLQYQSRVRVEKM